MNEVTGYKLTYDDLCTNLILDKKLVKSLCVYMGLTPTKIVDIRQWNILFNDYLNTVVQKYHKKDKDVKDYDLNRDRARLAREQAMTHKVRRRKLAGELITIGQHKELATRIITVLARGMDNVPRMLRLNKNVNQDVIDEVMKILDEIREKMSESYNSIDVYEVMQDTDVHTLESEHDDSLSK